MSYRNLQNLIKSSWIYISRYLICSSWRLNVSSYLSWNETLTFWIPPFEPRRPHALRTSFSSSPIALWQEKPYRTVDGLVLSSSQLTRLYSLIYYVQILTKFIKGAWRLESWTHHHKASLIQTVQPNETSNRIQCFNQDQQLYRENIRQLWIPHQEAICKMQCSHRAGLRLTIYNRKNWIKDYSIN